MILLAAALLGTAGATALFLPGYAPADLLASFRLWHPLASGALSLLGIGPAAMLLDGLRAPLWIPLSLAAAILAVASFVLKTRRRASFRIKAGSLQQGPHLPPDLVATRRQPRA